MVGEITPVDPVVRLVDADSSTLGELSSLVASAGFEVRTYDSQRAFFHEIDPETPGCALIGVSPRPHDIDDARRALQLVAGDIPILFTSEIADAGLAVELLKAGAADYLVKPVAPIKLIEGIDSAVTADADRRRRDARRLEKSRRLRSLTKRQREVLDLVLAGRPNKHIASALAICERTVEVHRAACMKKLGVHSQAELFRDYMDASARGADSH